MLGFSYLPEHMGTATLTPVGPFVAGTHVALVLTYTSGQFGIDDSGDLKVVWRGTSDMGKPQFTDPTAANYTTVEASNGAVLEARVDRNFTRPWVNALSIRVGRGFLRGGETITIRLGDTRKGSPGLRLQTNVEPTFEFQVLVDAFAGGPHTRERIGRAVGEFEELLAASFASAPRTVMPPRHLLAGMAAGIAVWLIKDDWRGSSGVRKAARGQPAIETGIDHELQFPGTDDLARHGHRRDAGNEGAVAVRRGRASSRRHGATRRRTR